MFKRINDFSIDCKEFLNSYNVSNEKKFVNMKRDTIRAIFLIF